MIGEAVHVKILLFIPMYNCEKQIVRVLRQITDEVAFCLEEVIIVNNRSTDNGEAAVLAYLAEHKMPVRVRLLRNDENYSLGGSHKVAFDYAVRNGFTHVIVLHGDDQGSIQDILPLLKSGEYLDYDSLLGSRFEKGSQLTNYSRFRIFGNRVFNFIVSVVCGKRITDLGSGLNLYSAAYLKSEFYRSFPDTLTFNVYLLLYGLHSGSRFKFFPLTWREEDQVSNAKFFRQSLEILRLLFHYLFFREKLFAPMPPEKKYTYQIVVQSGERTKT